MRAYEQPADVESEPMGEERPEVDALRPARFAAWGRVYVVAEAIECWSQDRPWYVGNEPGTTRPVWYWRVRAMGRSMAIVVLREDCGTWHVVGVED
jgi:hypothetical protein